MNFIIQIAPGDVNDYFNISIFVIHPSRKGEKSTRYETIRVNAR